MPTVDYEMEEWIFLFDLGDAVEALKSLGTDEARDLIEFFQTEEGDTVRIPQDKCCFPYAVLKLLDDGKGAVFCKVWGAISFLSPQPEGQRTSDERG
jgi:hypothetical protein